MGKPAQPGTEDCRCDLCGSDASLPLPHYITRPHRVVICQGCGLIYSNPRSNRATQIYARHHFDTEKQVALETWGRHLDALLTGQPSRVVPFAGKRR